MIHVCFADYDKNGTYSKYVGVAIASLFACTKAKVTVHLLHDDTLTAENRHKFEQLAAQYRQQICFHEMNSAVFASVEKMAGIFSIGTLFRLSLLEVMPPEITKLIYLDSDIIVNLDIQRLWDEDMQGFPVAATLDHGLQDSRCATVPPWPCRAGMVESTHYFNAGVMVLDLARIRRQHDLRRECLQFLSEHPQCKLADQDALNVMFCNNYAQLPQQYNCFTRVMRGDARGEHECIIHISGDYVDFSRSYWWNDLFLKYWLASPWGNSAELTQYFLAAMEASGRRLAVAQKILRYRSSGRKFIFWGAGSVLYQEIVNILVPHIDTDYFVDNNARLQGCTIHDLQVLSPKVIREEQQGQFVVVILSCRAYPAIRAELEQKGLREDEDFFDGRWLLFPGQGGHAGYY